MNEHQPVAEALSLAAEDSVPIAARLFRTEDRRSCRGSIVIAPAMGVRSQFYTSFARACQAQGLDVLCFDYRGIGESRPATLRGCPATLRDWAQRDLVAVLEFASANGGGRPVFVVGHSVGGQLAGISKAGARVDAMLLVAAQSGYFGHWSGWHRLAMQSLWYVLIPAVTRLCGYFPAKRLRLGEDLPASVALEWARWGRQRDYLAGDRDLADALAEYAGPILAYSFSDDAIAPRAAVQALLACYRSASITHRHVDPADAAARQIGHFGYFRTASGASLWERDVNWLLAGKTSS